MVIISMRPVMRVSSIWQHTPKSQCKFFYWFIDKPLFLLCRQELVIFRLLVGIMLGRTWHLSWMLHALSILLIGFQLNFFGKLWSTLMKQRDSIEGNSFVLEWMFVSNGYRQLWTYRRTYNLNCCTPLVDLHYQFLLI